jgi:hypothetical protein
MNGRFERIDGTGDNGVNREIAVSLLCFLRLLCFLPSRSSIAILSEFDLLVDGCLVVDVIAKMAYILSIRRSCWSDMKLADRPLDLIINVNELKLTDGISRLTFGAPI